MKNQLHPGAARLVIYVLAAILALAACQPGSAPAALPATPAAIATAAPALPPTATNTPTYVPPANLEPLPTPTPTSTPLPPAVWIDPSLPIGLRKSLSLPEGVTQAADEAQAAYRVQVGQAELASQWLYLLVTAFPSLVDDLPAADLRLAWEAGPTPAGSQPLRMSAETEHTLAALWGEPGDQSVEVLPEDQLLQTAWDVRPALAIVPFEALEPRWKVVTLDGQSPLSPGFDAAAYPLAIPIALQSQPGAPFHLGAAQLGLPASNFDPQKLSRVVLTGVTALVRGTALTMQARGITYPAQDILPWLTQADILHISNEIPFFSQCPPPELYPQEIKFCSPSIL